VSVLARRIATLQSSSHRRIGNRSRTDPDTFEKPLVFSLAMQLLTDTEMLEEVCESKMDFWNGTISDLQKSAVRVSPDVLKQYVGNYEGYWRANVRTVT
jgi:hypothetical protein